jgi:uncharacterized membrane protein
MEPIKSVERYDNLISHWMVGGPFGTSIEWDAITTRMEADSRIAWTSKDDGDIKTSGQVTFKPLPYNETLVTVTMRYQAQKKLAPSIFENLFGDLDGQLTRSLRRFKHYAEHRTSSEKEGAAPEPVS